MIRVMLVDDHALVRMGFRMLLAEGAIDVVAEADSGEQAYQRYPEVCPDIVVMDLCMPGMGGLEAIRRLAAQHADARMLALSAHQEAAYARRALRAGALGYLTKRSAPDTLLEAVRDVAAGHTYLDPDTARALALSNARGSSSPADALSEREFAVFIQLATGSSVSKISDNLKLAPSTVGTHLYNIKQKLGAINQSELTLAALRWGLIQA